MIRPYERPPAEDAGILACISAERQVQRIVEFMDARGP